MSPAPTWTERAKAMAMASVGTDHVQGYGPLLETDNELWFYLKDHGLVTGRDGALLEALPEAPVALVTRRVTLYKLAEYRFVEAEVYGETTIFRRGVLNGASREFVAATSR